MFQFDSNPFPGTSQKSGASVVGCFGFGNLVRSEEFKNANYWFRSSCCFTPTQKKHIKTII